MSKTACVNNVQRAKAIGKKSVSHGTYRCKRKPNSPRCKGKDV